MGRIPDQIALYNMRFHETLETNTHFIIRVPGGWIYYCQGSLTGNFIPFSREYKVDTPPLEVDETDQLIREICELLGEEVHEVMSKRRSQNLADTRKLIVYALKERHPGLTNRMIADIMGFSVASTAQHARAQVRNLERTDEFFREKMAKVRSIL